MIVIIIETNKEDSKEYLYIISIVSGQKLILEKLHVSLLGGSAPEVL